MKRLFLFLIISALILPLSAQDITSVFLSMPDDVFLGLDAEAKDKLIAQANDTSEVKIRSVFGGEITRQEMSEDYLSLQTSTAGILQIKLLPLVNNSRIICVVKTVCGKACDSNVRFYTTDWEELSDVNLFPKPDINWFIKPDVNRESEEFKNAYAALDMRPMKMELDSHKAQLNVILDAESYLSEDDYLKFEPFLTTKPHILKWDKISFK